MPFLVQGSQRSGKTWKIKENLEKLKNQGKPEKLKEISWNIKALRKNAEKIFTLLFNFMIL